MPFTKEEILNEFVEAASVVTDWQAEHDYRLMRNALHFKEANRLRAAQWSKLNRKRKNAYMRAYGQLPEVKERRRLRDATPEGKERLRAKNKAYYMSVKGNAVRKAWKRLHVTDAYREKERLRHQQRIASGYFTMEQRKERAKRKAVSVANQKLPGESAG